MRLLVCGGRDFHDVDWLWSDLDGWRRMYGRDLIIVSGGARGADNLAFKWALATNTFFWIFPADWDRLGRRAGPVRNTSMNVAARPQVVIAYPGGAGTADMVRKARKSAWVEDVVEYDRLNYCFAPTSA